MNPVQLNSVEKMVGKTIRYIVEHTRDLLIRFTDDTFIKLKVYPDYDYDILGVDENHTDYDLLELGCISKEEYDRRQEQLEADFVEEKKNGRKKLYEELKREFEGE